MPLHYRPPLTPRTHEYANGSTPSSPHFPDSPVPSATKYDPTAYSRPSPYTQDELLLAYIRSGLGSITTSLITPDQTRRALAGEKVRPTPEQKRKTLSQSAQGEEIARKRHYA